MLEYEIKFEDGKITIVVERDQYDYDHEFDNDSRVYELEESLVEKAQASIEKPVYLTAPHIGDVFVIHRWGTTEELEILASGKFEIVLSDEGETTSEAALSTGKYTYENRYEQKNTQDFAKRIVINVECPVCGIGQDGTREGDYGDEPDYLCGHFVAGFNEWMEEAESFFEDEIAGIATHMVAFDTDIGGTVEYYFQVTNLDNAMTTKEIAARFDISDATVRQAIKQGVFSESEIRQSGSTWLISRKAAEARWGKKTYITESNWMGDEFSKGDVIEFQDKPNGKWKKATIIKFYRERAGKKDETNGYVIEPHDHRGTQIKSAWRKLQKATE